MNKLTNPALGLCLGAMLLPLAGCLVGPRYHRPAATAEAPPAAYKERPAKFKESGDWKVARPRDTLMRGEWWKVFKDPELNALEAQLNVNDQNIRQSGERFVHPVAYAARHQCRGCLLGLRGVVGAGSLGQGPQHDPLRAI